MRFQNQSLIKAQTFARWYHTLESLHQTKPWTNQKVHETVEPETRPGRLSDSCSFFFVSLTGLELLRESNWVTNRCLLARFFPGTCPATTSAVSRFAINRYQRTKTGKFVERNQFPVFFFNSRIKPVRRIRSETAITTRLLIDFQLGMNFWPTESYSF